MSGTILLVLDPCAARREAAYAAFTTLARSFDEVILLRAAREAAPPGAEDVGGRRTLAETLRSDGRQVSHAFRRGAPAEGVAACAREARPDLLVLAASRAAGWRDGACDPVAEAVVARVECPVLLWREAREHGPVLRRIVVPLDGTELSARILHPVEGLARRLGALVVLFHVEAPFGAIQDPSPATARRRLESVRDSLNHHRRHLERAGVRAVVRTHLGSPAEEILRAAEEAENDAVAVTVRGRSGPAVSAPVLGRCPVPVLVLGPRAAELQAAPPTGRPDREAAAAITPPATGSLEARPAPPG